MAVLLAFFEGEEFFDEQINSILSQSHKNIEIWISDESRDKVKSKKFLLKYINNNSVDIFLIDGPGKGCSRNFLYLACNKSIKADFYAFSDQDDIWETNKLSEGLNELLKFDSNVPSLFGSRTIIIDKHNDQKGFSPLVKRKLAFVNAVVQSFAGGNTMMFNQSARKLLMIHGSDIDIKMHDWWLYLLVSGAEGKVIYSKIPLVRYRQHPSNIIGENNSFNAKFNRIRQIFDGSFKSWMKRNNKQLLSHPSLLSMENYNTLKEYSEISKKSAFERFKIQRRVGLYRQNLIQNIFLNVAIIFGLL